jgi:hypothetical protein
MENNFFKVNDILFYDRTIYHLVNIYFSRLRRKLRKKVTFNDDERAFMNQLYIMYASWFNKNKC